MKKKRVIPVVLFKDGHVVQSKNFSEFRNLGHPYDSIRRLSEWGADEVAFIDISSGGKTPNIRNDLGRKSLPNYLDVLSSVSETAFMPLSSGGHIESLNDIYDRLSRGADKVIINSASFENLEFLAEATKVFGSQCITVSMDVKIVDGDYFIFVRNGQRQVIGRIESWIDRFNAIGIGELFFTCINRKHLTRVSECP